MESNLKAGTVAYFRQWFSTNADQLRNLHARDIADSIHGKLKEIDGRLGVEVSDGEFQREIVVSAGRESELFGLVDLICDSIRQLGWRVQSLKPARGFAFKIKTEGVQIDAHELFFEPLESKSHPHELGIRLFAPEAVLEVVSGAAWWIIETGIGERAAAGISYLEVARVPSDPSGPIPLRELAEFLEWRARQRRSRS